MEKIIEIDGSLGEGGGQVLRTSLALSLITGRPFRLRNIRAGRSKPGLQAQHLMSVKASAEIGQAKLRGASLGSCDLTFEPGKVSAGNYHFKIGTAGATSLVLHTIYLPLALADGESTVTIEGSTHVKASPCFHFLLTTWAAYLRCLGINVLVNLERYGFYPRGGGLIQANIKPAQAIHRFEGMTTPTVRKASVLVGLAGLPTDVSTRMAQQAGKRLDSLGLDVETRIEAWPGGPGCMIGSELPTEPAPTMFFSLGERGKPAEFIANEVADQVAAFLQVQPLGVDEHSADQLLLPLALAEGVSQFRVARMSSHLLTNADVIQHFLDREILCEGVEDGPGVVSIG